MTGRVSRSIALALGAMLAACAAPAKEAAPVSPAITQADLDKVTQDQVAAMNTGDGAKAGAVYATDAVFVSARGAVETQAAITSFWTEAMKNGAGKDLKINIVKFGTSGDLAYTLSRFTGGITAPSGHVLAVSKRQADGSLKIVMQVSIPDPPAAKK